MNSQPVWWMKGFKGSGLCRWIERHFGDAGQAVRTRLPRGPRNSRSCQGKHSGFFINAQNNCNLASRPRWRGGGAGGYVSGFGDGVTPRRGRRGLRPLLLVVERLA